MSVLIKGMEMPKSCEYCDLCTSDGDCIAMGGDSLWDALPEDAVYFPNDWKHDDCPLAEVLAPHGDLIDIDSKITVAIKDGLKVTTVRELLNDRAVRLPKTIIEAEDE